MSRLSLDFSVSVGAFVIGLSQISSFSSSFRDITLTVVESFFLILYKKLKNIFALKYLNIRRRKLRNLLQADRQQIIFTLTRKGLCQAIALLLCVNINAVSGHTSPGPSPPDGARRAIGQQPHYRW